MNVVYFDALEGDAVALATALPDLSVVAVPAKLTAATVAQAREADVVSIFVTSRVTWELLGQMPRLRHIAVRSAGVDHVDLAACQERGIVVSNVPRYGERTVAEHTFALILALSRKIFQSYERTERMNFDRTGLQGFDLEGKTLGVVGTGNIGLNVVKMGQCFGMKVIAYDVEPDAEQAQQLGFTYVDSLDTLLIESDVVTLHVPYFAATHHLINTDNVQQMKQGALLINTARGGLVDTQALLAALEEGKVAGAGLDVLEEEDDAFDRIEFLGRSLPAYEEVMTLLRNHLLVSRDDVIITPHNAYNSREAVQRIFDTTVENIRQFVAGMPSNVVS